jgi:hypothetical protein
MKSTVRSGFRQVKCAGEEVNILAVMSGLGSKHLILRLPTCTRKESSAWSGKQANITVLTASIALGDHTMHPGDVHIRYIFVDFLLV